MTVSLKSEILERLNLRKGGKKTASRNISKATKDFGTSDAPQFRGKSQQKRHQMAVAAGLSAARGESAAPKRGDKVIYEGKTVTVDSYNPNSGMAIINRSNKIQVIVRAVDLSRPTTLTEGFLGMSPIMPTWVDREPTMKLETLSAEDIGLEFIGLREDDFEGEKDEQEEEHDNGSNIRHDGHTGKKEVDELPTPSDTIAPAYSDEKPPKEEGKPLSTVPGAEEGKLWQAPDWDGYDYPADAPEIPDADFQGDEAGNARAPLMGDGHDGGDGLEKRAKDKAEEEERTDETYLGFDKLEDRLTRKKGIRNPAAAAAVGNKKYGKKMRRVHEAFRFITEMGDMLGHEDKEPTQDDTITVTLPAMASILCTVAHHMGADIQEGGQDEMLLKAIVEALCEVGKGAKSGCLDLQDLQAVASHINGEETQEMQNREGGRPDHEGIDGHDDEHREPADKWPGDGEKSHTGKMKVMDDVRESGGDYYGMSDIVASLPQLTDEQELRLIKRRAGLKFW